MSKIAVCLFGLTGGLAGSYGKGKKLDPKICFDNYKKYIFQNHKTDFFIHSWSINKKDKILNLYKPKRYTIEKQKKFNNNLSNYSLNHIRYIKSDATRERFEYLKKKAGAIKSFFYSLSKSGKSFLKYSKNNRVNYDLVIFLRFDLFFNKKLDLSALDKKSVYVPLIKHKKHKKYVSDLFFIMSPRLVEKFVKIYEDVEKLPPSSTVAFRQFFDNRKIKYKSMNLINNNFYLYRLMKDQKEKKLNSMFSQLRKSFEKVFIK